MTDRYREAMGKALYLADRARETGDVPVGAVVLDTLGRVVGKGWNCREKDRDPAGHAEIVALRDAARTLKRWNLVGCTLVVSLEPCTMCAGAIVSARVDRVVFGAWDPKAGAAGSVRDVLRDSRLNHQVEVVGGVLGHEAAMQLRSFFAGKRPAAQMPVMSAPSRVVEPGPVDEPVVEASAPEEVSDARANGAPSVLQVPGAPPAPRRADSRRGDSRRAEGGEHRRADQSRSGAAHRASSPSSAPAALGPVTRSVPAIRPVRVQPVASVPAGLHTPAQPKPLSLGDDLPPRRASASASSVQARGEGNGPRPTAAAERPAPKAPAAGAPGAGKAEGVSTPPRPPASAQRSRVVEPPRPPAAPQSRQEAPEPPSFTQRAVRSPRPTRAQDRPLPQAFQPERPQRIEYELSSRQFSDADPVTAGIRVRRPVRKTRDASNARH